jgi:hypothetical protein
MKKKHLFTLMGLILLSLLLTVSSTSLVHLPWIISSEQDVLPWLTKTKKYFKLYEPDFIEKNFLLINTAVDIEIGKNLSYRDSYFSADGLGPTIAITNRKKLQTLFKWLANNSDTYNYVICNILFEDSVACNSAMDDSLRNSIEQLQIQKKIILASRFDVYNEKYIPGIFPNIWDCNKGIVNKTTIEDFFITQRLSYGTTQFKSLPLLMLEKIKGDTVRDSQLGFIQLTGKENTSHRSYNSLIPEILFNDDYFTSLKSYSSAESFIDTSVCMINLGEVAADTLVLPALLEKKDTTQRKNLFIGSFTNHMINAHRTLYGDMDGSVIILNTYYDLIKGQNLFNPWCLACLFLVYLYMLCWVFFHSHRKKASKHNIATFIWENVILGNHHYLVLLIATFVCYYGFKHVINIIVLTLFFAFLETVLRISARYRSGK